MNKHFFLFCKYLFRISLFGLYATMFYGKTLSVYAFQTANITKKTNHNVAPVAKKTNRSVAPVAKKNNRSVAPVAKKTNRSVAPVARLEDWRFYPETLQLEMSLSAASQPRHFYLAQPPRIVIDLPGTKLGRIHTQQNFSGAIRTIRVSQLNADVTRIVMDLAPGSVIDPKQVQLQPVSRENPNRWVLSPLIASNGTNFPQGNLPSGMYNPPQPPGNLPSGMYNPPQPPGNLPSGMYNPPQSPGNLPSGMYNPPQRPDFSVPPPLTTLPATTNNFPQTPSVRVPPFSGNNPSQIPSSIVAPLSSPYQPGNSNNSLPSVGTSNFPVPNAPSYPPSSPNSKTIEFGKPFPNRTR